jgi:hypothetical protein
MGNSESESRRDERKRSEKKERNERGMKKAL